MEVVSTIIKGSKGHYLLDKNGVSVEIKDNLIFENKKELELFYNEIKSVFDIVDKCK